MSTGKTTPAHVSWRRVGILVAAAVWIGSAFAIAVLLQPSIIVERAVQHDTPLPLKLPIIRSSTNAPVVATIRFSAKPWQIHRVQIAADDCIQYLSIDTEKLISNTCPRGRKDTVREYDVPIHPDGSDTILTISAKDTAGTPMGLNVMGSQNHWGSWLPPAMIALAFITLFLWMFRRYASDHRLLVIVLFLGCAVRIMYGFSTPYDVRSYDAGGHFEYVRYLSEHTNLPPAKGWEFHQPPLYYVAASLIVRTGNLVGWSMPMAIPWIQLFSIITSCLTFFAGAWIGVLLYGKIRHSYVVAFTVFLAGFPGLIMFSSRISNDPLLALEIFTAGALLLRWWRDGNVRDWYLLWLLSAVAFLTKLNGISIPLALIMLELFSRKQRTMSLKHWVTGLLIFTVLTAWLPVVRFHQQPNDIRNLIMTGKSSIDARLRVTHMPQDFLTFNPIAMFNTPFNKTRYDPRRSNSLEFLFRSALFGEFNAFSITWLAQGIVILAFVLLLWMGYGLAGTRLKRDREDAPVIALFLSSLLLWLGYILIFQLTPEQDFRFSPFFAIAAIYFILRGIDRSDERWRSVGVWCIYSISVLNVLLLVF